MARKIAFVDRDGTLIREPADQQVDALDKIALVPGVIPALLRLRDSGYSLVIVSNQDGLGTAAYPQHDYDTCQAFLVDLMRSQGIDFDAVFVCPHVEADNCNCRKPRTGLLTRFLAANTIDLEHSVVIGDRPTDLELAANLGVQGFLIDEGRGFECTWAGIAERLCHGERFASVTRNTNETRISATVHLDSSGPAEIATGIGFFDHMLEQVARHGGFRLKLTCDGDLHIDEHHTVEDAAICLGAALREALGDKRGIGRYGFVLPMDESEAQVAIDLSGRGAFVFNGEFRREQVGGLSVEMVRHFFSTLADSLGAAIHIRVTGDNAHHMIEACFKAVGRALRPAIRMQDGALPSTKGLLA